MADVALPLTYQDLVCVNDLDPFGAETTSDLQSLTQDVFHILKELPGSNPDDPDGGVGIDTYLNGTEPQFKSLAGTIENQLNRDDRVTGCSVTIGKADNGTPLLKIVINASGEIIPLEYGWQNGNFTNLTGIRQ